VTLALTPLAHRLITRAGDRHAIPRYGSEAWDALPDQDPRRAAAILIAAEAWRDHLTPERIAQDLTDEIHAQNHLAARLLVETSHDVYQAADWENIFNRPTHAELQRRRGEA
jgi:hypothetical protein